MRFEEDDEADAFDVVDPSLISARVSMIEFRMDSGKFIEWTRRPKEIRIPNLIFLTQMLDRPMLYFRV
eukprot:752650-Hanusia_phi.AAC.1